MTFKKLTGVAWRVFNWSCCCWMGIVMIPLESAVRKVVCGVTKVPGLAWTVSGLTCWSCTESKGCFPASISARWIWKFVMYFHIMDGKTSGVWIWLNRNCRFTFQCTLVLLNAVLPFENDKPRPVDRPSFSFHLSVLIRKTAMYNTKLRWKSSKIKFDASSQQLP